MPADYETILDDIITEHKAANGSLWQCASGVHALYGQYGMYERDFTATLTRELAVGIDTLYHWRKAWELRISIESTFHGFMLGKLSISHFYQAADYVDRMGLEWVYDWLVVARDNHWSSRRLSAELMAASDESGTRNWLYAKLNLMVSRLGKLYGSSEQAGFTDLQRKRLRLATKILSGILNDNSPGQ